MMITLWGTRGSLAAPGPETVRYGGNTPCVEVRGAEGDLVVLDAGTGIRRLGANLSSGMAPLHLLLTHLHMDHIQGLGFFDPLYEPDLEVHIWGPASTTLSLRERLARYLSPPLFPLSVRELPCRLTLHDVPRGSFEIGGLKVTADLVCHPGPTVGYRIQEGSASICYMPDHEPALVAGRFDGNTDWISGFELALQVDMLIHDAQYSDGEYEEHVGWGHSSIRHALQFAVAAQVKQIVAFHHDPNHADSMLDQLRGDALEALQPPCEMVAGTEGASFQIGPTA
jgi:phosphoribosyl 1,2-cyclic phosphodiesterase